jgi:hypothetical protein
MNDNARALPVGALATYALKILNSTALTTSTVASEEVPLLRCFYLTTGFDSQLNYREGHNCNLLLL